MEDRKQSLIMEERKLSLSRKPSSTCVDDRFDRVMEKVGFRGKFQLRFNFVFNFILVILVSMPYLNIILALAVPDHWCHVPGRNGTNYTLEEWKELTLPKEFDIKGKESTSKCKMYNISLDNISLDNISAREINASQPGIIECQYGWDFDRTWYTETAPSQGVWVCEKQLFVSNAFAFGRIGDVVGTCIFGQLGDALGRRPVFFLTLLTLIFGRTLCAFTANNFSLFAFSVLVGSLPSTAVFQAPLIVAMEVSEESRRAHIAMMQCVGWTVGMCFMPFILWGFGHWFEFMLATTLPCVLFLFSGRLGRRPVFFLTLLTLIFGRTLCAFTANNFSLFAFSVLVGSLPSTAVFQAPLIVAMEVSEESRRAHIAMMQCVGWTVGMCFMPFILWGFGHWFEFMLATTLPCVLFLFSGRLGRRPVFFLTLLTLIFGRTLCAFTANNFSLFAFSVLVGSLPSTAVFQAPLIVAMEVSEESRRAHIAMMQCVGWTVGMCFMPFILWGFGHWFEFMLATTLPCVLFLFSGRLGRRPVFFLTLLTLIFGRTLCAFTANNFSLFAFSVLVGSLPSTAVFQAPLIVAMEVSEESRRAHIAMMQCVGWTVGMCFMPFILWGFGHWFEFMLATTLPCVLFLFSGRLGRRPVFFLTLLTLIFGRTLCAFTANNFSLFAFSVLVGSLPSTAVFQAPLIVAMEVSEESRRAHIAMMQCVGWTVGMCFMPFILWGFGHWFEFMLATTLPCVLFLFSGRWMIESPRWLASQGKTARCIRELEKIAEVNGTKVPADAMVTLSKHKHEHTEKAFGIYSLFTTWRLARNTLILLVCWINGALMYYVIVLNVNSLEGNPFMNFFWQGLAELPAYVMAKILCDKIGRRWTQVLMFLVGGCSCIVMAILITDPTMEKPVMLISSFIKFCIAFVFYGTNLQTLEIYPTCVRQSGLSLCIFSGSAFGILGPYVVYLGTSFNACYPPIVLAFLAFSGALAASFLPETLHQKLPETLADAQQFGTNQKFWSLPQERVEQPEVEKI